jgi:hydroxymethylbilane synthase
MLSHVPASVLEPDEFPPAVGQGAIAIAARADNQRALDQLAAITDADTEVALAAERAFLAVLDGSCRTPIAGHAVIADGELQFYGMILRPNGSEALEARRRGERSQAMALGADAAAELKSLAPADFFHG